MFSAGGSLSFQRISFGEKRQAGTKACDSGQKVLQVCPGVQGKAPYGSEFTQIQLQIDSVTVP